MTQTSHSFLLAGATAVALAFSATSGNAAGLIDNDQAVMAYAPALSGALAKAVGHDGARITARGFFVDLETALKVPSETTRVVDFPPRANAEFLRVIAVVPPKGFEALPIPVCAEQNNKVLGTWAISPKGEVTPAAWTGSMVSDKPTSSACKAFIVAARTDMNQKLANTPPVPLEK